ncbi:MAG: hypothetical protein V3T21_00565 [Candidatus Margulisiibacteriota bacterium]
MGYLFALGSIILVFAVILLFAAKFLGKLGEVCNRVVLYLDEKLQPIKVWIGLLLIAVGGWLLYVVANYPELGYLTSIWIICLLFGLLFLVLPNWLSWLSNLSNKIIFSTDEVVMGSRNIIGIVVLIISIYVFYAAYAVR